MATIESKNIAKAVRCINFVCDQCGKLNYHSDSLEKGVYNDKPVMEDKIDCVRCNSENYVYIEIEDDHSMKKMVEEIANEARVIVCAAIRHYRFNVIICGPRHFDSIMNQQIKNSMYKGWADSDQGFVDQFGTFLTREEALLIAKKKNQIIKRVGGDSEKLYSENLY